MERKQEPAAMAAGVEAGPSVPAVRLTKKGKAMPGSNIAHPKFEPKYLTNDDLSPLPSSQGWVTPLSCPAYFPLDVFHKALHEQALHPEQNSSLIIRADSMRVVPAGDDEADDALAASLGCAVDERLRLRFMPRQPRRDSQLEQRHVSYTSEKLGLIIKTTEATTAASVPYYYPPVRKLAFVWEGNGDLDGIPDDTLDGARVYGTLFVAYLPFTDSPASSSETPAPPPKAERRRSPLAGPSTLPGPSAPSETVKPPATVLEDDTPEARQEASAATEKRLQRTCLALLERLHKHGYGHLNGYVKRVHHDIIVSREPFQDLYQALKERHKHLESRKAQPWSTKVEDVKRHVWKGSPDDRVLPSNIALWGSQDIAICAFLMLLWKDMYPAREGQETGMAWDLWGRPPGGFVDLGCGNGLIVHILVSEGYVGKGYELRERRTWPEYPQATQDALVELAIDMPSWFPQSIEEWESGNWPGRESCAVKEGSFIIANHADELTPWIPLLSLIPSTPVPFISLPCCLHTLDDKFQALEYNPPPHEQMPKDGLDAGLEAGASRYKAYTMWLGWEGLMCGWKWEKESLRIPSTRGWAIVARERWATKDDDRACREWALAEVQGVRARQSFAVRKREGKDH